MSSTESRIKPSPPTEALQMAKLLEIRSIFRIVGNNLWKFSRRSESARSQSKALHLPECLSHRSMVNESTNVVAVTEQPAMKSGLSISAPMSDMNAMEPS